MFKEELKRLTEQVSGARGGLIMGMDGITVDSHISDDLNLEALSAEYLSMVKKAAETNRDIGIGSVVEMSVFTENVIAIMLAITPEYFLVFAIPHNGSFGRARYEVRKSALRLANELS